MNSDHSDHSDNSDQQITYQLKKKRRDSLKDYGTSRTTLPDGDASCLPLHARCHIRLQHRSREQDAGKGDLGVNKFDRIPRGAEKLNVSWHGLIFHPLWVSFGGFNQNPSDPTKYQSDKT